MTAREALQRSRNIPVKSFNRVPHDQSRSTRKLGFNNLIAGNLFEPSSNGGLHIGVTVEQNTNAFSVFTKVN
ncbi:hypothetical protein KHA80_16060 [Anaerobacillus sp. HL2]|nr:hypothetical protein KHA80_16060 [Anaerobacillus sp. HL2]